MQKEYISRLLTPPTESFFLLGPRGTGKSTWLNHTYLNAVRIDLLLPEEERRYLAAPERLREITDALPAGGVVILDEIQRAPGLLPVVHSLIEEGSEIQFIMTGSSARKLRREVGNLLGGRALLRLMPPFYAAELGEERFDLEKALKVGLLPMVWESKDSIERISNYAGVYLREEVIAEGLVRQVGDFARFLETLSFSQGNLLNVTNLAREAQVKRTTVNNYLQILEDLLLAFQLPIFTRRAKRSLTSHPKFYYFDVGVFRSLRPRGPLDRTDEIEGAALEGLVAQHLRSWALAQREPYQFCFWRTQSQLEVDFVIYGEKGFWAIEVKRGKDVYSTDLKGLKVFKEEYPECIPLLLYLGKEQRSIEGILCLPLREFLLQLSPKKSLTNY